MSFSFDSIGLIRTPFREKFGTPSGSFRVPSASGIVTLHKEFSEPHAFDELVGASHCWLIYVFHQHLDLSWNAKIRPPRLGGEKKVGLFASRSPFRPNPIGLSCVEMLELSVNDETVKLHVRGVDMLDGTPLLDIKPYQKEVDSYPQAQLKWAAQTPWPEHLNIHFPKDADHLLNEEEKTLFREVLQLDPRPSKERGNSNSKKYQLWLGNWDIEWSVENKTVNIHDLRQRLS